MPIIADQNSGIDPNVDQLRSMLINADQFRSIPLNAGLLKAHVLAGKH